MAKRKKEDFDWQDEEQEEIIWVSKSEIKRDAEALKKLGEKLVELTKAKLDKIPLEDPLITYKRRFFLLSVCKKKHDVANCNISVNYCAGWMLSPSKQRWKN